MSDARELLAQLHQSVAAAWNDAHARWRDAVAVDFERRFWTEINQATRDFLTECERSDEILSRAESAIRSLD